MAYLIGTDEAGYGPNLGPLVIVATVWRVPVEHLTTDLYETLADTVTATPQAVSDTSRVCVADSKVLYKPAGGLERLESSVLAALEVMDGAPGSWQELWRLLDPASDEQRSSLPWYQKYDTALPLTADPAHVQTMTGTLRSGLDGAGIELQRICARAIFPERFNAAVEELGSKGAALTHWTLDLVRGLLRDLDGDEILVNCDKHGGRNRYAGALQHFFPDALVEVRSEGRAASVYRLATGSQPVEIRFCAGGEAFLPSALASMVAKYLRETAMIAFNKFWCAHVAGLRPTAGYPLDARRFKAEIASSQLELQVSEQSLWRCR